MAHKKGQGSIKNGRDSNSQKRGVKKFGGEVVRAGVHTRGHTAGTLDVAKQVVRHDKDKWVPPVLRTVATRNEGVGELLSKLAAHRTWLLETESGKARRYERLCEAMRTELRGALFDAAIADLGEEIDRVALAVARRETSAKRASAPSTNTSAYSRKPLAQPSPAASAASEARSTGRPRQSSSGLTPSARAARSGPERSIGTSGLQMRGVMHEVVGHERRDEVVPVVVAIMSAQRQRLIDDSASSFELFWKELSCQKLV